MSLATNSERFFPLFLCPSHRLFDDGAYRTLSYRPAAKYDDDEYAAASAAAAEYNDVSDDFRVYWNVPTFQCHKHGYDFAEVAEWGIRQNTGDVFRGDQISLLYDPGQFPALLQGGGSRADHVVRNGGVPHEGNLTEHLRTFAGDLVDKLMPDPRFSGESRP